MHDAAVTRETWQSRMRDAGLSYKALSIRTGVRERTIRSWIYYPERIPDEWLAQVAEAIECIERGGQA